MYQAIVFLPLLGAIFDGFFGRFVVDRACEVPRIVCHDPNCAPFDPSESGNHAKAEVTAEFEHGANVEEPIDHEPDVVRPQPIDRNNVA